MSNVDSKEETADSPRGVEVKSIIGAQLELWRLSSYVATQGPVNYCGEFLSVTLSDAKKRTTQLISMGAAQSVSTLLKCSDWRGIPVRDLYPIARSSVESFINASYLLVENEVVAERAVRWVAFRGWKHVHRGGRYTVRRAKPESAEAPFPKEFSEFKAFKDSDWTSVKVPDRAKRVVELAGNRPGSRLLGAYDLIYPISSEVIHGSPFGISYFNQLHVPSDATVEEFRRATAVQYEDILVAVSHALAGYLSTFFWAFKMALPYAEEQWHFNRLLKAEGMEPQSIHFMTKEDKGNSD